MAGRERKRKPTGTRAAVTPTTNQIQFPAQRRSVRARPMPWSAPPQKQQTITQMNPFFSIFHPEMDDELQYEEDIPELPRGSNHQRKRRRINSEETPIHQNYAKQGKKQHQQPGAKINAQAATVQESAQMPDQRISRRPMPPKTPISKNRIIPSSQSPAESPLSTQSRRTRLQLSRSPLKERSSNIKLRDSPRRQKVNWKSTREIANSMSDEDNDDDTFTTPLKYRLRNSLIHTNFFPTIKSPPRLTIPPPPTYSEPNERFKEKNVTPAKFTKQKQIKKEISDSDNEEEQDENPYEVGNETQAAIIALHSDMDKPIETESLQHPSQRSNGVQNPDLPPCSSHSQPISEKESTSRRDFTNTSLERSDPDLVSAQLQHELQHSTQNQCLNLENESQYDVNWLNTHPPPTLSSPSSSMPRPSSQNHEQTSATSTATTVPTQLLPAKTSPPKQPIPPSQATTVDTTQPSPVRKNIQSSPPQHFRSSPPPVPPFIPSSSPLPAPNASSDVAGYVWNGVPLRDSQMLPESLMNDDVVQAPRDWTSWDLEEM